jgi:DNA-binding IclR family transcriptional regulator
MEKLSEFDSIGVTQLARRLDTPVANVYRTLQALEKAGYVEQFPETKEYRLTLKVFELGSRVASRTTIRDIASVEIERLAHQNNVTTNYGALVGGDVLYLAKVETDDLLTLNLPPGSRAPATCTGMGKAMLAFDPQPLQITVGEGPFVAKTQYSLVTLEELEEELAVIRSDGYAIDRQELALGLWCVAAPILDSTGHQAGAISLAVFRPHLNDAECSRLGKMVQGYALRISKRMGELGQVSFR